MAPMDDGFPRIEPLGEAALLVRFTDRLDDRANRACVAFADAVRAADLAGVVEVASSLGSVLVRVDRDGVDGALAGLLATRDWGAMTPPPGRTWRIPCSYGGEDGPGLAGAAAAAGMSEAEAVAELSGARVRVLALGFAPGMPYLGILPVAWDLPRRTDLTPKVPAGALVVAVRQMVLFGTEAPTGWHQVGRTLFDCFRADRPAPIALRPGDMVSFPPVSAEELRAIADGSGHGGATCEAAA